MRALEFWSTVTADRADLLGRILRFLDERSVPYCVVGGQAVNAYAEPVVSLDLDLAVASSHLDLLEPLLAEEFAVLRHPHSLNVSDRGSDLRVQFQTDPRYGAFPERAKRRDVLGLDLPVADIGDVLQGKVWAALDPGRRKSKRQKDLADIARLIEGHPHLKARVPAEILARLL